MKKILILAVAALLVAVGVSEAKQVTLVQELAGTTDTLADNAIDTLTVVTLDRNIVWTPDNDAADGTGSAAAYVVVAFTAAGMDSFRVFLDLYVGEQAATHHLTTTSFVARTSATMFSVPLASGVPAGGASLRVRLDNADVTGGAACTNLDAYLIQVVERE